MALSQFVAEVYGDDFIKMALSQFVAEIYGDDFIKMALVSLLLRLTEMILMLLAYKINYDFCQSLSNFQIFHSYIIDAFRLFSASSHSIIARFSIF